MTDAQRAQLVRTASLGFAGRPGVNPGQPFQPGAVTGGLAGPLMVVRTDLELRLALDRPHSAWVVWAGPPTLRLGGPLVIRMDNKTLVGPLTLTGHGVRVDRAMNVIVCDVKADDLSGDAFEVSSSRVVSVVNANGRNWTDGAIDIVRGSTDVSVINAYIYGGGKAKKGSLVGGDDKPWTGNPLPGILGPLDDRHARVSYIGCTFENVAARAPLARHGIVHLHAHRIIGGGKRGLIEARTGARVVWLSGGVQRVGGRPFQAATDRGHSAKIGGRLYVAPGVQLDGATVQSAPWQPAAGELQEWGVLSG